MNIFFKFLREIHVYMTQLVANDNDQVARM